MVEDLFTTIAAYANEYAKEFEFDDEEYSAIITVDIDEAPITLKVSILKVDEEKHCVEVSKENGERFGFSKAFSDILKYFGGHANATY